MDQSNRDLVAVYVLHDSTARQKARPDPLLPRPSGNAPEFRCYNEADSLIRVENLNHACTKIIEQWRQ